MKKTCTKCGELRENQEFSILRRNPDGLHTVCKICTSYKNIKYKIDKYSQWLSLKKRASLEKAFFNLTQVDLGIFLDHNRDEIQNIHAQNQTPFITRIENFLPYKPDNLKIIGKEKNIKPIVGKNTLGQELHFSSMREAGAAGFSRKAIVASIVHNKPYKDYIWQYS